MKDKFKVFLIVRIIFIFAFLCGILHDTKSAFLFIFCLAVYLCIEIAAIWQKKQSDYNFAVSEKLTEIIEALNTIGEKYVNLKIDFNNHLRERQSIIDGWTKDIDNFLFNTGGRADEKEKKA